MTEECSFQAACQPTSSNRLAARGAEPVVVQLRLDQDRVNARFVRWRTTCHGCSNRDDLLAAKTLPEGFPVPFSELPLAVCVGYLP